jgi:diphthamide synthase (EF-2-diphthine--ammonia ligase)
MNTVQVITLIGQGLGIVTEIVRRHAGRTGEDAAAVLAAVSAILDDIDQVVTGKVEPAVVRQRFDSLRSQIASNDAAIDALLREKFGQT